LSCRDATIVNLANSEGEKPMAKPPRPPKAAIAALKKARPWRTA
jgi:hypothetical protein